MSKSAALLKRAKKLLSKMEPHGITRIWVYKPLDFEWKEEDPLYTILEMKQKPDSPGRNARTILIKAFEKAAETILGFKVKARAKDNLDEWIAITEGQTKNLLGSIRDAAIPIAEVTNEPLLKQFNQRLAALPQAPFYGEKTLEESGSSLKKDKNSGSNLSSQKQSAIPSSFAPLSSEHLKTEKIAVEVKAEEPPPLKKESKESPVSKKRKYTEQNS